MTEYGQRHAQQRMEWEALLAATAAQHGQRLQEKAVQLSELERLNSDLAGQYEALHTLYSRVTAEHEVLIGDLRGQAEVADARRAEAERERDGMAAQISSFLSEREAAVNRALRLEAEEAAVMAEAESQMARLSEEVAVANKARQLAEAAFSMHHEAAEGLRASYEAAVADLRNWQMAEADRWAAQTEHQGSALRERCLDLERQIDGAEAMALDRCRDLEAQLEHEMMLNFEARAAVEALEGQKHVMVAEALERRVLAEAWEQRVVQAEVQAKMLQGEMLRLQQALEEVAVAGSHHVLHIQDDATALICLQQLCSEALDLASESLIKSRGDFSSSSSIQADLELTLSVFSEALSEREGLRQRCQEAEEERDQAASDLDVERRVRAEAAAAEAARLEALEAEERHRVLAEETVHLLHKSEELMSDLVRSAG